MRISMYTSETAIVGNGRVVHVGDSVGFKCGVVQYGIVIGIEKICEVQNGYLLRIRPLDGKKFKGNKRIRSSDTTEEYSEDCW